MSQILPFKEIFNQTIIRIPDYQRGFSWEESQLEELWADLSNIHLGNNAYHFTGILTVNDFSSEDRKNLDIEDFTLNDDNAVLLNGEEYQTYNLVDGQQRLTTILILLSQLLTKLRDAAERALIARKYFYVHDDGTNKYLFGYHVDVPSRNFLIRDIFEDNTYEPEITETLYTHNLAFAKKFFQEKLLGYRQNNVRDLITKITDRLLFSILNLSKDAGNNLDISMVFETLNFRGKHLSGLERFKNRTLYLLSKQNFRPTQIASRRTSVNKTWLEIYKWLGRNPSPKKVMDDDAFLKAFWLMYFSKSDMVAKDFKSYQKNLFDNDFNLLNIHTNIYMQPDTIRQWLTAKRQAVVLWYFINNPYDVETDSEFKFHYTSKIQRSLLRLNSFPFGYGRYTLNLILAVLVKLLPPSVDGQTISKEGEENLESIEKFLWAVERHNIMCFLFYGNKTNFNQESIFREINRFYKSGSVNDIQTLTSIILNEKVSHFKWDIVLRNITMGQDFYNWDGIFFILREYEESLSGNIVRREFSTSLIFPDDQNIATRVFYRDISRLGRERKRKYSYALGNVFMSNNSQEAKAFTDHKTRIQNAIDREFILYESEIELLNYSSWKATDIIDRTDKILNFMVEKWDLPNAGTTFTSYYN